MKRIALYLGIAAAIVASCSIQEEDFIVPRQDDVIFYASFEQPSEGTKVYANEDLLLRWTADDRVSIFNKLTYNQQYKFTGETGDNAGGFRKVDTDEFVTGNTISHVVSVYPYQEGTKITESESLSLTLPVEQHYAENTFGLGANTMVSVSEDNLLQYKNVGGYLRFSLYGEGVKVSSITLKGNNGEKLAGKATVTMPLDGTPTVSMTNDASDEITLLCNTPVELGATAEESTEFWFVVPPVSFSKGFTISVNQTTGGLFEKSTSKSITIERNSLSKMSPVEVEKTFLEGNIVFADEMVEEKLVTAFDVDGDGKLSYKEAALVTSGDDVKAAFDGNKTYKSFDEFQYFTGITRMAKSMFFKWNQLTSIVIPDGLTNIEESSFARCTSLSSITLPESVTSIGEFAFDKCTSLSSITLPKSVTSIGYCAFIECRSLTRITIPEGVKRLEGSSFALCSSLSSIILPESLKSIGDYAFVNCANLSGVSLPESMIRIEDGAFCYCTNLRSITIPKNVTKINAYTFQHCTSLSSITLPEGVTSIGDFAFEGCTSLNSITLPKGATSIGDDAFNGCASLSNITLLEGITSIGSQAFCNCSSLKSIVIPESVNSIGDSSFAGCRSLTSVMILSETPPTGGMYMFDATNNAPIYVPSGSVEAYKSAQYWIDYADRIQAIHSSYIAKVPEAIDLGLPSGIKWASFNLGATSPEEYGDYFAWGEVTPKANYSWSTYKYCDGSSNSMTKYCLDSSYGQVDGLSLLESQDDAASINLGEDWRMPTKEEWTELMNDCSWVWTTVNGKEGYLITGKKAGFTENSIFLPAAGIWDGTSFYPKNNSPWSVAGSYWSSNLGNTNIPYNLDFDIVCPYVDSNSDEYRYTGQSIRPVWNGGSIPMNPVIDLSKDGTANCYIVSTSGSYKFNATVKGNSLESLRPAVSAEVMWESFGTNIAPETGDIIASVELSSDGYVLFATPEELKDGNALIAIKDAVGTVLWSWHIWVCKDFDPEKTASLYANNAGVMMDRNLGALSATPGDNLSIGLLYQWGRKDPFMGSSSLTNTALAAATPAFPTPNATTTTIEYTIEHPSEFIAFQSFDWLNSTNDNRWKEEKTIYDPCPPGWKVPQGGPDGFYATAFGTSKSIRNHNYWDSSLHGLLLPSSISGVEAWYPASGARGWGDARLVNVGSIVEVYSSLVGQNSSAYTLNCKESIIYPSSYCTSSSATDYFHRVDARSVRCVRED